MHYSCKSNIRKLLKTTRRFKKLIKSLSGGMGKLCIIPNSKITSCKAIWRSKLRRKGSALGWRRISLRGSLSLILGRQRFSLRMTEKVRIRKRKCTSCLGISFIAHYLTSKMKPYSSKAVPKRFSIPSMFRQGIGYMSSMRQPLKNARCGSMASTT